MWDYMASPEGSEVIRNYAVVIFGIYGVIAWQRQQKWKAKFDLLGDLYSAVFTMYWCISMARFNSQVLQSLKFDYKTNESVSGCIDIVMARQNDVKDHLERLESALFKSVYLYGDSLLRICGDLILLSRDFIEAADIFILALKENKKNGADMFDGISKESVDMLLGKSNDFTKRLDDSVLKVKQQIKKIKK